MYTLLILFIGMQLLFAALLFFLTLAFLLGAPFVPSAKREAQSMIMLSGVRKGMKVYDLGSGDGRLLFLAAQKGARATGYEINPFLVLWTRMLARFMSLQHLVEARCMNFWQADVRDADVIYIYLIPWRMTKLKQKLLSQLKPGSLVVSNSFIFKGWKIHKHDPKHHIYTFRVTRKMLQGK